MVTTTLGSTGTSPSNILGGTVADVYDMQVFNGVHYFSQTSSNTPYTIGVLTTPYPTAAATPTAIITTTWTAGRFFVYSDTVIYAFGTAPGSIRIGRFTKSSGTWSVTGSKSISATPTGIMANLEGGSPVIYYTTATRIWKLTDAGTANINSNAPTQVLSLTNVNVHDISMVPSTCTNGALDGTFETDVDCGKTCAVVAKCANGKTCSVNTDCVNNDCNGGICGRLSIHNVVVNGTNYFARWLDPYVLRLGKESRRNRC